MLRTLSITFAVVVLGAGLLLSSPSVSAQDEEVLDCEDFVSQAEAQAAYREDPTDPAGNDADGDGIACELFDGFEDDATDLEPIEGVGADTTAATATETAAGTTTLASTGAGSVVADAGGSTGIAAVVALLAAAAGCGALALRGLRRT